MELEKKLQKINFIFSITFALLQQDIIYLLAGTVISFSITQYYKVPSMKSNVFEAKGRLIEEK